MLNILRASLRTGRVTEAYPCESSVEPAYRGRPRIDQSLCRAHGACADVCPSGAITLTPETHPARSWRLDLARCLFCGLCEEACTNGAIKMTNEFELASRNRQDLIVTVNHGATIAGGSGPAAPATAETRAVGTIEPTSRTASRGQLNERLRGLLSRSLHIRHMAAGSDNSTDWEIAALLNPIYDVQRLGIDFVASPRHADLLLVTGAVTRHLESALRATYDAMPSPRLVVAAGDEACGGGVLGGSYAVAGGVDRCLPVDVYVPGDPPRPEALIQGFLVALDRLEPKVHRTALVATEPASASLLV
jgi:Ni,Fe-hydrogenase III small subunit/formate hydrogenlyase subunit 6/NADH:ubiquinone oxidoreductase subunit I